MIVLCVFFPSCVKRQKQDESAAFGLRQQSDQKNGLLDAITQQEAMLIDIPLPLYDERIFPATGAETDTTVLGYKSPLTQEEAIEFFIHQMERYGWKNIVRFDSAESLLQFESPDRYCTISIKKSDNRGSCIYIYIKRASPEARP